VEESNNITTEQREGETKEKKRTTRKTPGIVLKSTKHGQEETVPLAASDVCAGGDGDNTAVLEKGS
jgi:hypothetical protein